MNYLGKLCLMVPKSFYMFTLWSSWPLTSVPGLTLTADSGLGYNQNAWSSQEHSLFQRHSPSSAEHGGPMNKASYHPSTLSEFGLECCGSEETIPGLSHSRWIFFSLLQLSSTTKCYKGLLSSSFMFQRHLESAKDITDQTSSLSSALKELNP